MTVRWCFEQAANDLGSEKRLVVSYINASSLLHKTKKEAMEATLGQLGITGVGQLDRTSRTGRNIVGPGVVILLIDEIDFLVSVSSSRGATGAKQTGSEKYLSWLFCLALNENFRLGLICTSNSICNDKASRLNALGMVSGLMLSLLLLLNPLLTLFLFCVALGENCVLYLLQGGTGVDC